jgi:ribonuclease HI
MRRFWTDGSAIPNPGDGGWAVIENGAPVALGRETNTTNIRMEARALEAAMQLAAGEPCEITTDSQFWINVITIWAPGWAANGWRKKTRGEIQNLDLVQALYQLYHQSQAKLIWTRSHVGTHENELADEWANRARAGVTIPLQS